MIANLDSKLLRFLLKYPVSGQTWMVFVMAGGVDWMGHNESTCSPFLLDEDKLYGHRRDRLLVCWSYQALPGYLFGVKWGWPSELGVVLVMNCGWLQKWEFDDLVIWRWQLENELHDVEEWGCVSFVEGANHIMEIQVLSPWTINLLFLFLPYGDCGVLDATHSLIWIVTTVQ